MMDAERLVDGLAVFCNLSAARLASRTENTVYLYSISGRSGVPLLIAEKGDIPFKSASGWSFMLTLPLGEAEMGNISEQSDIDGAWAPARRQWVAPCRT